MFWVFWPRQFSNKQTVINNLQYLFSSMLRAGKVEALSIIYSWAVGSLGAVPKGVERQTPRHGLYFRVQTGSTVSSTHQKRLRHPHQSGGSAKLYSKFESSTSASSWICSGSSPYLGTSPVYGDLSSSPTRSMPDTRRQVALHSRHR